MPITLVTTVGSAAANAYADVAQADAQAAVTVGPSAAAWLASVNTEAKKQALITATRDIDTLLFIGARVGVIQALEWPRESARVYLTGRLYADDAYPSTLIAATIELAFNYLANATVDVLNPVVRDKRRVQAGDVSVEYFAPGIEASAVERFPAQVQRYLLSLLAVYDYFGRWGSALVVRTS